MRDVQEGPGYRLAPDGTSHDQRPAAAAPVPPSHHGPAETIHAPQNRTVVTVLAAVAAAVLAAVLIVGVMWYEGNSGATETRAGQAIAGQSHGVMLIDTAWGNASAADKAGFCETYRNIGPRSAYKLFTNGLNVDDPPTVEEFTEHFDEVC